MGIIMASVAKNLFDVNRCGTPSIHRRYTLSGTENRIRQTEIEPVMKMGQTNRARPTADARPVRHTRGAVQEGYYRLPLWEPSQCTHQGDPEAIYQQLQFAGGLRRVRQTKIKKELWSHSKPSHQDPQQWIIKLLTSKDGKIHMTTGCPSRRKYDIHAFRKWASIRAGWTKIPDPLEESWGLQTR